MPRSYRLRLALWAWGLLLLIPAVVMWRASDVARSDLLRETVASAFQKLDAAEWLLTRQSAPANAMGSDQTGALLTGLGEKLRARFTLVRGDAVLADSEADPARMESHANRPEVLDALRLGSGSDVRRSATLGQKLAYVAKPLTLPAAAGAPGDAPPVLRAAVPFSEIEASLSRLQSTLLWTLAPVLLGAGGIIWWTTRRVVSDVRAFTAAVQTLGQGDYSARVRVTPGLEFEPLADAVNAMAKSLRRREKDLRTLSARAQAVLDSMSDGVAVLDRHGLVETVNPALERMFPGGTEGSGFAGRTVLERFTNLELHDAVARLFEQAAGGAESVSLRMEMETPAGRTVEVRVEPFRDHKNRPRAALVFRDLTERVALERGRRQFVVEASHELRTPLTVILGYAETMQDLEWRENDPQPRAADLARQMRGEAAEAIRRQAEKMREVVNALLKKFQAGTLSEEDGRRPPR